MAFAVIPETPFGRYTLIGKLGQGGMAEVFLAYAAGPAGFRKLLVIKRLHRHLEDEPGFLDMFLDEARLAARLNHQNVVQTYEVGKADGSHFIAMEYLEGQAVDQVMKRCAAAGVRLPPAFVARVVAEALEGLHYAHELKDFDGRPLGVVHRDVSPHNIFVTYEGLVKVVDFGIAKASTHVVHTGTGIVKGKLAYMAPEQAEGYDIDRRVDLWSMGVVLWEALVGRRLFRGGNDLATWRQTLMGEIPYLKDVAPKTPESLVRIAHKALQRDPAHRYHGAEAMKADLEEYLATAGRESTKTFAAEFVSDLFADVIEQHRQVLRAYLGDASAEMGIMSGEYFNSREPESFDVSVESSDLDAPTPVSGPPADIWRTPPPVGARTTPTPTPTLPLARMPAQAGAPPLVLVEPALAPPARSRVPRLLLVAVGAFVVVAASVGFLVLRGGRPAPAGASVATGAAPAASAQAEPVDVPGTSVVFTSTPPRAEVILGDEILGRTPLERELPVPDPGQRFEFIFRLEGHEQVAVQSDLAGDRPSVHADLVALAQPPPERPVVGEPPRPPVEARTPPSRGRPLRPPARGGEEPPPPATPPVEPRTPLTVDDTPVTPRERPGIVVDERPTGVPVVD